MFHSAVLKLTGLYLLILMLVSIFFSFNLYRISSYEVNNRLLRQVDFINSRPEPRFIFNIDPIEQERLQELQDSRRHIFGQLIYANVAILLLGGAGSYLLAKRTIRPIEEAHAAQTRFTADASHELRTPIAAMRAENEVALRNSKLNIKDARILLQSNLEELERLTALSEGLLQLARGSTDKTADEEIDIKEIIDAALGQVGHIAQTKHITIKTEHVPAAYIQGNKTQLIQLLVILLDNAIKYSPKDQAIAISGVMKQNQLQLKVTDNGYGIAVQDLPHIFERFYRVDAARSKANVSGHGLGLSIAQQIALTHKGQLEVTSVVGVGSVFILTLPARKP